MPQKLRTQALRHEYANNNLQARIALVPIVGLLLNYTSWGIRLTLIVLSLVGLTTVFATVAVIREYQKGKQSPIEP